jgi:hypothetical protein
VKSSQVGVRPRRQLPGNLRLVVSAAFVVLALVASARAAITIEGVQDKKVYADRVSFTIQSEAGFDYMAELNGGTVAVDVVVEVNQPDYYELNVQRRQQSSGAEESRLVRFIVRASERGNTEWGLPVWTPYPPIDSAEAEFADAALKVITPDQYPVGLEIPIVAWVVNASGSRRGVNGVIAPAGFEKDPLQLRRGVGSVFLPAATQPGAINYPAQVHSLEMPKQIVIEQSTDWQVVSADIAGATDWGENARIRIQSAGGILTITSGAVLTIGAGSVVVIDPGVTIAVKGRIVVNGTPERPVVFTAQDRTKPWGGFLFESASSQGDFRGAILTASGADASWFTHNPGHGHSHRDNQCLFYLSNGARVTLTDCFMIENHGQLGHGENAYLTMTGCLVQKCVMGGQYNGGALTASDCAFIEFPSAADAYTDADNDAFYLSGGAHAFTDCLIGWTLDDGIDAGDGAEGSVTFDRCWIESCYHEALALSSGPRHVKVTDTVALNCGQGIEAGYGTPLVDADHCLCTANLVGARFGDNYDWTYSGFLKVTNSLLLFNYHDVWGRAWDNWTVHLSQMDIHDNYLSAADAEYPNNQLWEPQTDPNQLAELVPFLPCPADVVGIGFATPASRLDLSSLANEIPVRLSTFTVNPVFVDYTIDTKTEWLTGGTLHFSPGETLKQIPFKVSPDWDLCQVRVTLGNPVNAELTGYDRITHSGMCRTAERLVRLGDEWRYFKGTQEPPAAWNALAFDDSAWLAGPTPIGYEASSGCEASIATNLTDMRNKYLSVYARRPFFVEDPSQLTALMFTIDFDDGYIAYINGVEVDSRYGPNPVAYNQPATTDNHEACCGSCAPTPVDLSSHIGDLVPGYNVLALQVHNTSLSSSDFIFAPELSAAVAP